MPRDLPRHTRKHPRAAVWVVVAVVLAAAAGIGIAAAVRHGGSPDPAATAAGDPTAPAPGVRPTAATPAPSPSDPSPTAATPGGSAADGSPSAPPAAPAPEQPVGVSTAPPVDVGAPATLATGVTATVRAVTQVRTVPQGPGDRAGPGVVVRLAVRNGSGADVDLSTLTVTATAAGVPAPPSQGGVAAPMAGPLATGAEASGTYVFRTATAGASPVLVQVGLAGSPEVAVVQQGA